MSHLVPIRRTNKNGVTATKWVRPKPNIEAPAKPIPAPKASRPVTKDQYANAISRVLNRVDGREDDEADIGVTAYGLVSNLGSKPLKLIYDNLGMLKNQEERIFFDDLLMRSNQHSLNQNESLLTRDRITSGLVEVMPMLLKFGTEHNLYQTVVALRLADRQAKLMRVDVRVGAGTEEDRMIFRYMTLELMLKQSIKPVARDEILPDAQWLEDNMDKLAPHFNVMRERATLDREFLDRLINNELHSSISEGIL